MRHWLLTYPSLPPYPEATKLPPYLGVPRVRSEAREKRKSVLGQLVMMP